MKRTIDDRDGNPVEIEIDDPPPQDEMLEEMIQALLIALEIRQRKIYLPTPSAMPGHESRYGRKKGKAKK